MIYDSLGREECLNEYIQTEAEHSLRLGTYSIILEPIAVKNLLFAKYVP